MLKAIALSTLLFLGFSSVQADERVVFCQNMNDDNGYVTYLDFYLQYNSVDKYYTYVSIDVYSYEDNFVFPNIFWPAKIKVGSAGKKQLNAKKDLDNYLQFELPAGPMGVALPETNGIIDRFQFQAEGLVNAKPFKGEFSCYDSSLFVKTPIDEPVEE